jgi:hypothetical protein
MNDFKVGQEIWCCEVCDFSHKTHEPGIFINIMKGKVHMILRQDKNGVACSEKAAIQDGAIISDENLENFKSKNEAIDAVIAELLEMKDE